MSKKILISLFAIVGIISMVNIASFGLVFPPKVVLPQPIANFSCGQGLSLYSVKSYTNTFNPVEIGKGMRCVKFGDKVQGKISLAWYGEGYESNCTYRTVGHAWWQKLQPNFIQNQTYDKHIMAQADIWGNGECRKENHSVDMSLFSRLDNYGEVQTFRQNVKEVWTKFYQMVFTPLPRITTCGNTLGFNQYKAVDGPRLPNTPRTGSGIRCVLRYQSPNTTWFGQGNWYNTISGNYTELGTKHPTLGYGSSQIFDGGWGVYGGYVLNRAYGSFNMIWDYQFATATMLKDEYWYGQ
jgi:hypothetical protein